MTCERRGVGFSLRRALARLLWIFGAAAGLKPGAAWRGRPTSGPCYFPRAMRSRGITLLELLVVMAIAGMILAISFPATIAGVDGVRLQAAGRRVAAFLNVAHGRADREQLPVEILVDPDANRMSAVTADGQWERSLDLGEGVRIAAVLPETETRSRRFLLLPGVPPPRFQVQLDSRQGRSITVTVDPLTGTPQIEDVQR